MELGRLESAMKTPNRSTAMDSTVTGSTVIDSTYTRSKLLQEPLHLQKLENTALGRVVITTGIVCQPENSTPPQSAHC